MTQQSPEVRPQLGRPPKYHAGMCDIIISIGEQGGHVYDMCEAIGLGSFDTFYSYINKYPEFKAAYDQAQIKSVCWWLNVNRQIALGTVKGNHKAVEMALRNKDNAHFNAESVITKNINVNHNHVITDEQYIKLLEEAKKLTSGS